LQLDRVPDIEKRGIMPPKTHARRQAPPRKTPARRTSAPARKRTDPHREWYKFFSEKYQIPVEQLKKEFQDELDGKNPVDAPLEIPDRMEVFFKYSYGKQSRFFRELRMHQRILGSKCPQCRRVYLPPRADCSLCYRPTSWVKLSGKGTVIACTIQHFSTSAFIKKVPFICAYIRLDGTDSLLMTNMEMDDPSRARPGMRVKAEFRKNRYGIITDFYFRPLTGGS